MAKRKTLIRRLQSTYRHFTSPRFFVWAGIVAVLIYALKLILETVAGNWITMIVGKLLLWLWLAIIAAFQFNPYLLVFSVFLLVNLVIILHAYIATGPPKGINIDGQYYDSPKYYVVVISNNTGDILRECELELVEMIKFSAKTPEPYIKNYKNRTPTKMFWINGNESTGHTTEIKDGRKGMAGVVHTKKTNDGTMVFGNQIPALVMWPGKNEAKFHFSSITTKGDTKSKDIFVEVDFDENEFLEIEVSI